MYRQIKIFLNILVFTSLVSASIGQSTRITSDPDADYKLAKEYYTKEEYSLAYPIFKSIFSNGGSHGNYPVSISLESKYYYIACGLILNDATIKGKAIEFLELTMKHLGDIIIHHSRPSLSIIQRHTDLILTIWTI